LGIEDVDMSLVVRQYAGMRVREDGGTGDDLANRGPKHGVVVGPCNGRGQEKTQSQQGNDYGGHDGDRSD